MAHIAVYSRTQPSILAKCPVILVMFPILRYTWYLQYLLIQNKKYQIKKSRQTWWQENIKQPSKHHTLASILCFNQMMQTAWVETDMWLVCVRKFVVIQCTQKSVWQTISKFFHKLSNHNLTATATAYHFQWSILAKRPLILVLPSARTLRDSYLICLQYLLFFTKRMLVYRHPKITHLMLMNRLRFYNLFR